MGIPAHESRCCKPTVIPRFGTFAPIIRYRTAMPDEMPEGEGPENLDEPPAFFPLDSSAPLREPGNMGELIEVQIEGIFGADSGGNTSRFVLVSDGERKLPILIGGFEATAITLPLEGTRPDRPLTHDLLRNILDRLDI